MTGAFFWMIVTGIAAYAMAPLLGPKESWHEGISNGRARRDLVAEKESYLRAMKDIEFEHASSKINDADYEELRLHYGAKAAKAMRALEQLPVVEPQGAPQKLVSLQRAEDLILALATEIAALKDEMDRLELEWDNGHIDDDSYLVRHDEYTLTLEGLLVKLERAQG